MNIKVVRTNGTFSHQTGGECAIPYLQIEVDETLPTRTQRALVRHAIIENYFRSIEHSKVEEVCELIDEALDQLEGGE